MISVLLRSGVLVAGSVVLIGGVYYLTAHGAEAANYHTFVPQPAADSAMHKIVAGVFALRARSVIQLGVLLLIATPVARVAMALVGFMLERDKQYVVITGIVLILLLYSLMSGSVWR
jgi:uncharacterized membrane protein